MLSESKYLYFMGPILVGIATQLRSGQSPAEWCKFKADEPFAVANAYSQLTHDSPVSLPYICTGIK